MGDDDKTLVVTDKDLMLLDVALRFVRNMEGTSFNDATMERMKSLHDYIRRVRGKGAV